MTGGVEAVADDLRRIVKTTAPQLEAIGETESLVTRGAGTWSRKQVLGHRVDSALNNLHRFVRAQQADELAFPDYDQPFWVAAGGYQERACPRLISLWAELNGQVAHVISRIPGERLRTPCRIGGSKPLTLEFIVRDYVVQLRHHLEQIVEPAASVGKAHPPFA